jgi:hypothetical protein
MPASHPAMIFRIARSPLPVPVK